MATIERPGTTYRMDVTEVTERAYARFLTCAPDAPAPTAACATVRDHWPRPRLGFDPATAGARPIRDISWCSAAAYCTWAGRRLCTVDEWLPACFSTASRVAAGGRVTDPSICVLSAYSDGEWGSSPDDTPQPVGSAPECRGDLPGYDEVLDVIGNVAEWLDQCEGGECAVNGHSFESGPRRPCTEMPLWPAVDGYHWLGFRCCADG
jgi:formylglycine-generating enzyme required for sulfatase activity